MFIDPKKVAFETKNDITDYVTRGFLPPTKSQFDEVMAKVTNPDASDENSYAKRGKEVVILDSVIPVGDRYTVDQVLSKVYENRVRNRNKALAFLGVLAAGLVFNSVREGKNKDNDNEYCFVDEEGRKLNVIRL